MTTNSTRSRAKKGKIAALSLVALAGVGLAACGGGEDAAAPSQREARAPAGAEAAGAPTVEVKLFRYQPGDLTVSAGTAVTWRNGDEILHTVTSGTPGAASGAFDEELASKGAEATVTFAEKGRFEYFCSRHPEAMRATVTVT